MAAPMEVTCCEELSKKSSGTSPNPDCEAETAPDDREVVGQSSNAQVQKLIFPHVGKRDKRGYWICTFAGCDKTFHKPSRLKWHEASHSDEKPIKCPHAGCTSSFKRASHLKRHTQSSHKNISGRNSPAEHIFRCEETGCDKSYTIYESLKKHVERVHVNLSYKCPSDGCSKSFAKRCQLRHHLFEHEGTLPFQCKVCGKEFKQTSHLRRHQKIHEGYSCDVVNCGKQFDKWSSLRKHKASEHRSVHACVQCDKTYSTLYQITRHIKLTHSADHGVQLYKCTADPEHCNKSYPDLRNLTAHVKRSHERPSEFVCEEKNCGVILASRQKLKLHCKIHSETTRTEKVKKKRRLNIHRKKTMAAWIAGVNLSSEAITTRLQPAVAAGRVSPQPAAATPTAPPTVAVGATEQPTVADRSAMPPALYVSCVRTAEPASDSYTSSYIDKTDDHLLATDITDGASTDLSLLGDLRTCCSDNVYGIVTKDPVCPVRDSSHVIILKDDETAVDWNLEKLER